MGDKYTPEDVTPEPTPKTAKSGYDQATGKFTI